MVNLTVNPLRVSRGKKCSFFEKFGVLCFLETPVLSFALLPLDKSFNSQHISTITTFMSLFKNCYQIFFHLVTSLKN